jgi:hypothetical protein
VPGSHSHQVRLRLRVESRRPSEAETTGADRAFLLRGITVWRGGAFPFPSLRRGAKGGGDARVGEDSPNAD